jgi:hypothetical protein
VGEKWVPDDCSYLCKGLFVLFYPINDMFINFFLRDFIIPISASAYRNHINFLKALILGCLFLTGTVFAVWSHKDISQAVFAKSIKDRVPIEIMTEAGNAKVSLYYSTQLMTCL